MYSNSKKGRDWSLVAVPVYRLFVLYRRVGAACAGEEGRQVNSARLDRGEALRDKNIGNKKAPDGAWAGRAFCYIKKFFGK